METWQVARLLAQNLTEFLLDVLISNLVNQVNWLLALSVLDISIGSLEDEFSDSLGAIHVFLALD